MVRRAKWFASFISKTIYLGGVAHKNYLYWTHIYPAHRANLRDWKRREVAGICYELTQDCVTNGGRDGRWKRSAELTLRANDCVTKRCCELTLEAEGGSEGRCVMNFAQD